MPPSNPSVPDLVPPDALTIFAEAPTVFAELEIQVGPAQQWGTAKGKVPPEQAHHLITTFGVLGSVVAGIAGAVLTLSIGSGLTAPALAELALALTAAVLIAVRRATGRQQNSRQRFSGSDAARRPEA
jgi:hypothetical protein